MKTLINFMARRKFISALSSALLLACLMAFGGAAAFAQNAKLNLSQLDKLASKASQVTNVDLDGSLLKLASEQMSQKAATSKSQKKAEVAGFLQRLKGVYVKSFEFEKPGEYTKADLDSVLSQLQSGGWKPIVHVEEKKSGETTGVYLMQEGEEVVGMAVVAAEPKELTVVNLVGPIDFSQLGNLGNLKGLGALGGLGNLGNSKSQLQHRPPAPKSPGSSK
ncbi:MAG: DUF4252 domain-containing protein [Acidobacteriota bacterium]